VNRWLLILAVALGVCPGRPFAREPKPAGKTIVERGRGLVRGAPPVNPPLWSMRAYANAWTQWGLKGKPADHDRRFRTRYGLHAAPYPNNGLPMGLHVAPGLLGKGIGTDCLLCHAGRVAGQTVIGLGNSALDLQGLFDEVYPADGMKIKFPVAFSNVRGTIDPISPVAFLMEFRDLELNLAKSAKLESFKDLASDPPAWWLLKKKRTRNWTGTIAAHSTRVDMATLLSPFNSGGYIKKQEPAFADIHRFVLSVEAPRFPFPIDKKRAAKGKGLFTKHCARCHGRYGPGGSYPNKVVPLADIGTDPLLARALTDRLVDHFNRSWFGREKGGDGKPIRVVRPRGYQAPPLDGVWATAPYFHNGSAPTVYHVLNSKARPKRFTRSYGGEKEDYDAVKLGLKFTVVEKAPAAALPAGERRQIYDATLPGRGNAGHTFGDALNEEERSAVIEYLKTL
jgi:mono/diheme cytochrome c family protein